MTITDEGIFVCDYCGEDVGKFNEDTGNHPSCIELFALHERLRKVEDALLISGNTLTDVKNFLEVEIKVCNGVGMECELGLVESIDAFQDLHGEMVKELGEKYAALRGES